MAVLKPQGAYVSSNGLLPSHRLIGLVLCFFFLGVAVFMLYWFVEPLSLLDHYLSMKLVV